MRPRALRPSHRRFSHLAAVRYSCTGFLCRLRNFSSACNIAPRRDLGVSKNTLTWPHYASRRPRARLRLRPDALGRSAAAARHERSRAGAAWRKPAGASATSTSAQTSLARYTCLDSARPARTLRQPGKRARLAACRLHRTACAKLATAVDAALRAASSAACAALTLLAQVARGAGVYELRRYTPPQEDLGMVVLPQSNLQNGDVFELAGRQWVVQKVSAHYVLRKGRYRKELTRLHVVESSRWLLNSFLDQLLEK